LQSSFTHIKNFLGFSHAGNFAVAYPPRRNSVVFRAYRLQYDVDAWRQPGRQPISFGYRQINSNHITTDSCTARPRSAESLQST